MFFLKKNNLSLKPVVIFTFGLCLVACNNDSSRSLESNLQPSSADANPIANDSVGASTSQIAYKGLAENVCSQPLDNSEIDFNNLSIELVQNGFKGAEGPVWISDENRLLFSEINRNPGADMILGSDKAIANIIALDPETGEHEIWFEASGSNGLALSPDARVLYSAVTSDAEITNIDLSTRAETVFSSELEDGNGFNATNDIVVRSDGMVYFTDPTWGGSRTDGGDPAPMSTPLISVNSSGVATVQDTDLIQPNGIALSPDEQTLYVNGFSGRPSSFGWNAPSVLYSYDVADDGSLSNRTRLLDFGNGADGMTVDCAGNIYTTARGEVIVLNREGSVLGRIPVFHYAYQASNVAFGGENAQTLFITVEQRITADQGGEREFAVYKVDLPIQGLPY